MIAAGFDAAAVMTGLGHYDTDIVVTVELSVQFLALALAQGVQAVLGDGRQAFTAATAVVKPVASSPAAG